jgi:hypothetical protein
MDLALSMTFLRFRNAIRLISFTSHGFATPSIPVPKNFSTVLKAVFLVFMAEFAVWGWTSLFYVDNSKIKIVSTEFDSICDLFGF